MTAEPLTHFATCRCSLHLDFGCGPSFAFRFHDFEKRSCPYAPSCPCPANQMFPITRKRQGPYFIRVSFSRQLALSFPFLLFPFLFPSPFFSFLFPLIPCCTKRPRWRFFPKRPIFFCTEIPSYYEASFEEVYRLERHRSHCTVRGAVCSR